MYDETVWLSIDQMAELFQRDKSTISRHIHNIFAEGELSRGAVVANFATTASDGKKYAVEYFNLDVIISVGYRGVSGAVPISPMIFSFILSYEFQVSSFTRMPA